MADPDLRNRISLHAGVFGYYRESLPQYSELTAAMNELKAKRKWTGGEWTPEMQHDFETL